MVAAIFGLLLIIYFVNKIISSMAIRYIIGGILYIVFIKYFSQTIKNTFVLYRQTKTEIEKLVIEASKPITSEYNLLTNVEILELANRKSPKRIPNKCTNCGAPYTYDRKTFSPNCKYCGSVVKINAAILRELNRLKKQEEDKEIAYQHELDKKKALSSLIEEKKNYLILTRWRIALYLFLAFVPLVGIFIIIPIL